MTKLPEAVLQLKNWNIQGHIIPHSWYRHLTTKRGDPYAPAIFVLSDILYWYRPKISMDEETGEVLYEKKFQEDLLQRSYEQFSQKFGISKRQAYNAITYLEEKGIIKRHFRSFQLGEIFLNNVLYIDLNINELLKISLNDDETFQNFQKQKEDSSSKNEFQENLQKILKNDLENGETYPQKVVESNFLKSSDPFKSKNSPILKERPSSFARKESPTSYRNTYTKNTYKTNYQTTDNSSKSKHIDLVEEEILKQFEFNHLKKSRSTEIHLLDQIKNIILDVYTEKYPTIRVNQKDLPNSKVLERFRELNSSHIEYTLDAFKKMETEVYHIRAYLITILYNSKYNKDSFYQKEAQGV